MKKTVKCTQCGIEFTSHNVNPKFCSLKCKGDFQAPQIDFKKAVELYESGMSQEEVGEELGVSQKSIYKLFRRNGYKSRVAAKRDQRGENNSSWKGDEATYAAFHYRVVSARGKPSLCSVCGTMEDVRYEWANLTGRYEDVNDYARMCVKCHRRYDKNRPNSMGNVKTKAK